MRNYFFHNITIVIWCFKWAILFFWWKSGRYYFSLKKPTPQITQTQTAPCMHILWIRGLCFGECTDPSLKSGQSGRRTFQNRADKFVCREMFVCYFFFAQNGRKPGVSENKLIRKPWEVGEKARARKCTSYKQANKELQSEEWNVWIWHARRTWWNDQHAKWRSQEPPEHVVSIQPPAILIRLLQSNVYFPGISEIVPHCPEQIV